MRDQPKAGQMVTDNAMGRSHLSGIGDMKLAIDGTCMAVQCTGQLVMVRSGPRAAVARGWVC